MSAPGAPGTGWVGYAERWARLHGSYDPLRAPAPVRGWLWLAYRTACLLARLRVAPAAVTLAGVAFAAAVPAVVAPGGLWPVLAAGLVVLGALADTTDGALALVTERETRLGRVYDSVADRLTEAAWLAALWVLGAPGWLITLGGAVAWLHEYARARAGTAGMPGIGAVTVGERPTRVLLVVFGLSFTGAAGFAGTELVTGTVTATAAIWTLLGGLGLVQLAAAIHRILSRA